MKKIQLVYLTLLSILSYGQDWRIQEIESLVQIINSSPLEVRTTITPDSPSFVYFKTEYCINAAKTQLLKVKDVQGKEGRDILIMTNYYFIEKELIKVEKSLIPPSGALVKSNYYFAKGKPVYLVKRPKKKERKVSLFILPKKRKGPF